MVGRSVSLKDTKLAAVAQVFLSYLVYSNGATRYMLKDNGSQFALKFFAEICQLLGAKLCFTAAYHP